MRERTFKLSADKTRFIRYKFGEQARIARALDIAHSRLAHYLQGRREIPESVLMQLCVAVDKKPSAFLESPAEKKIADQSFSA